MPLDEIEDDGVELIRPTRYDLDHPPLHSVAHDLHTDLHRADVVAEVLAVEVGAADPRL